LEVNCDVEGLEITVPQQGQAPQHSVCSCCGYTSLHCCNCPA